MRTSPASSTCRPYLQMPVKRLRSSTKALRPRPNSSSKRSKDGFGFLSPQKFKAGFAHDATEADAAFLRDAQVPINMSVFGTKLKHAAWRSKPSWAVIATEDKAFDQAMLLHMAERIGAKITKVSASHAVFMTQPKVVSDTIERASREAASAKQD